MPTTPVRRTGARNDAATEKYEAAPPSTSVFFPARVSTVSSPTDPTTKRGDAEDDMFSSLSREVPAGVGVPRA